MLRTICTLSLPLALLLTACTGDDIGATDTQTGTATDSDPTTSTSSTTTTSGATTTTAGTTMGSTSSTSAGTETDTTATTSTTTGVEPECTKEGEADDACAAEVPFCQDGKCVDCSGAGGDASCSALDPNAGVCAEGSCVQCTMENAGACVGTSPVCDTESSSCVKCTEHVQCGDVACNLVDGSCFASDYVLYVDKTADCANGTGAVDAPFCTLVEAFAKIGEPDNLAAAWTVRVQAGTYSAPVHQTPDNSTIAVLSQGGPTIIRSSENAAPGLTTGQSSVLFMRGLVFSLSSSSGLKCSGATIFGDDVQARTNEDYGIETVDCDSHLRRALISQNQEGGIASYGAGSTNIVNSYVTANGTALSEFGGIRSAQGNALNVLYSSVISNDGDVVASIQCVDASPGEVRNSVVIGRTNMPSVACDNAVISGSVVDDGEDQGDGNYPANSNDLKVLFENAVGGIYRVKALVDDFPSPIAEVAIWLTGDPKTDYDGHARAAVDSMPGFPGADVPAP